MLVSYRGDFGDGNWWGSSVGRVTEPVLRGLGISYEVVRSADEIPGAIRKADRSSAARSCRPQYFWDSAAWGVYEFTSRIYRRPRPGT